MRPITTLTAWSIVLGSALLQFSCATGSGGGDKGSRFDDSRGGGNSEPSNPVKDEEELVVSGRFRTLTFSHTNNPFTMKLVKKEKAHDLVNDLQGDLKRPEFKDRKELVALMAVKAAGGFSVDNLIETAQKLVNVEMSKDVRRDMPDVAALQIVLSAVRTRNFAMAEHFISTLSETKNKKVKAGLLTAEGFMAYMEDRVPEAIYSWNEALKAVPNYEPALLNIGYTALRYGDYVTARKMLGQLEGDWFALTGVMIASRIAGDHGQTKSLCNRILSKKDDYKPALLSCALHKYEGEKDGPEAIKMLQKLVKEKPSLPSVDERAFKLITRIEEEVRKSKEKAAEERAKREAAERAEKALKASERHMREGGGGGGAGGAPSEPAAQPPNPQPQQ